MMPGTSKSFEALAAEALENDSVLKLHPRRDPRTGNLVVRAVDPVRADKHDYVAGGSTLAPIPVED